MTTLKIDPWDPEYGGSVEIDEDHQPDPEDIDFTVEGEEWKPRSPAPLSTLPRCAFIDGVRRVDIRLFAEDNGRSAPAIAGSWAAGAAWSGSDGGIDSIDVQRRLIIGGELDYQSLDVEIGGQPLTFKVVSVPEGGSTSPLQELQNRMRETESRLAEEFFEEGRADLILADGPLTRFTYSARLGEPHEDELDLGLLFRAVVGIIKRQHRAYLRPQQAQILGQLEKGERTPLFLIKSQRFQRYSWYARIADLKPSEGVMTGIMRLEVNTDIGKSAAQNMADITTALLPRFATRRGRDPRAPQNLYPVGQLEKILRRRLGDARLVRRALKAKIWRNHE